MRTRSKTLWLIAGLLCAGAYAWLYSPAGNSWRSANGWQQLEPDSSDAAYHQADLLALIAGVTKRADGQYVGLPAWQSQQDLFGLSAPGRPGRVQLLEYKRFQAEEQEHYFQGAALFRIDTIDTPSQPLLGVQPLTYDPAQQRVQAKGPPLLALVAPPGGQISAASLDLAGDLALLRFTRSNSMTQPYQRQDAGLMALSLQHNRLWLALHYVAALTPANGACRVGQPTACRQVRSTLNYPHRDGDIDSAYLPSLTLHSTLTTAQGQQRRSDQLRYDPSQHAFRLQNGQDITPIDALSPAASDAFLASIDSRQTVQDSK